MRPAATVAQSAGQIRLRARARRSAYLSGRALAEGGDVELVTIEADVVVARVSDQGTHVVEVHRADDDLVVACSCADAAWHGVCPHAVAVEHAIWTGMIEPSR